MYRAGWGKKDIQIKPQGYAMYGYGQWNHRAYEQQTPLYARALFIADQAGHALIFCCLDLGCVTGAMRAGICTALQVQMGEMFNESTFVLTATHTHSGPGGCAHEALYNMPTPGFVPAHVDEIVNASVLAITSAWLSAAPTDLGLGRTTFALDVPVAWNRSLASYNRNPDVTKRDRSQSHLALDRSMALLSFRRDGELNALLSLFGVHATCLGNTLNRHDGDNKGYAAAQAELTLEKQGVHDAVAIFAQATAGDVSPHYHGKGEVARRKKIFGAYEYVYAEQNGRYQSEQALSALSNPNEYAIQGNIDSILSFIEFSDIHAAPEYANGETEAWTSDPCHGVAFFKGTPVDGPGIPPLLAKTVTGLANATKAFHLRVLSKNVVEGAYYQRLYAAQGNKAILFESGAGRKRILGRPMEKVLPSLIDPLIAEMKRQIKIGAIKDSPLVPTRLPLQIITIGQLALVCCPGEFTTMAGKRLLDTVRERLIKRGIEHVLICTYCNDYMGYVTTQEEYQQQAYEGGHTLFGQWTLAAFQTCFADLAEQLLKPDAKRTHDRITRPLPVPAEELLLRSHLAVPKQS